MPAGSSQKGKTMQLLSGANISIKYNADEQDYEAAIAIGN
jgi:hypothetical protein